MPAEIEDPRVFRPLAEAAHAPLLGLAEANLAATTTARAEEIHRTLTRAAVDCLRSGRASVLADAIAAAPSPALARELWRCLIDAWSPAWRDPADMAATLFALPVVIIAARDAGAPPGESVLPAELSESRRLVHILVEHRALRGNQAFALAPALVASDEIDVARLDRLFARQSEVLDACGGDFPATPIAVQSGQQTVHLRFLLGTALAAPGADLLENADVGGWGMPLALELARQLASPGISVLALPRPPQSPPAALQQGRIAQREVGAQLFASNAIRKLRATVGEPVGVISAHHCAAAPGGGELRVSLSSPFDVRAAEGFRCPLFATDRADDVASMLHELLRDCRVTDVRVLAGVHPDRDPRTGVLLFFKPTPQGVEPTLH
ncbi:MAG TPA: hypothetical protein VL742_21205 [Casimicrobiaceae bacterium]|nr:hypothetical protein [Casimicrobiaceae bacterium]